jgi:8-oxo-dGTP diphosphatase
MQIVRVAGGVLWRGDEGRLALVHRPRHGDWSLPKGKLEPDETWHAAALREVAEETGCTARITRFAGAKLFLDRDVPKLVLYWHMRAMREGELQRLGEVDEVAWLSPREALGRLDPPSDRQLLLRALASGRWQRAGAARAQGLASGARTALGDLVVVDVRPSAAELAPYLRLVERAIAHEVRRALRLVGAGAR